MSRFAIRSNLATLAMAVTSSSLLAAPVLAAAPADEAPAATHASRHGGGSRPGMRDGLWIAGLGTVSKAQLDQLKLDDKQQALVKTARAGQRGLRDAMRTSGGQRRDLLKAQLDSGRLDPRALLDQADQSRDRLGTQAKQVRGQWLAVWDSLNEAQRGQVTEMVKERQAKMQARRAKEPDDASGAVSPPAAN